MLGRRSNKVFGSEILKLKESFTEEVGNKNEFVESFFGTTLDAIIN